MPYSNLKSRTLMWNYDLQKKTMFGYENLLT